MEDPGNWLTNPHEQIVEGDQQHASAMEALRTDGRKHGFVLFTRGDDGHLSVRSYLSEAGNPNRLAVWASFIREYSELLDARIAAIIGSRLMRLLFSDDEEGDGDNE
jgi:hypothetical protein